MLISLIEKILNMKTTIYDPTYYDKAHRAFLKQVFNKEAENNQLEQVNWNEYFAKCEGAQLQELYLKLKGERN